MKKLFVIIIALVLLSACNSDAPSSPPVEVVGEQTVQHVNTPEGLETAEIVEFEEDYVSIALPLPEGWDYKINEHEGEPAGGQGITIFKSGDESRTAHIQFTEGFGVCGTGLETVEADFPSGEKARVGYYDGSEDWSFITFYDTAGEYDVRNTGFTGEDAIEALEIIGQAEVGGDWLTKSQAEAIALEGQPEYDYVHSTFDPVTGIWKVSFRNNGDENLSVVTLDAEGNMIT